MIVTAANAIPTKTTVRATYFDGTEIVGTITERSWFFDRLDFYVVTVPGPAGREWETREYRIYPSRDEITPV